MSQVAIFYRDGREERRDVPPAAVRAFCEEMMEPGSGVARVVAETSLRGVPGDPHWRERTAENPGPVFELPCGACARPEERR
jgi:hypothetical protein